MADRLALSSDAAGILRRAEDEARQHAQTFVGGELLLLGLLDLPHCTGARVLAALIPSPADLRLAIEATLGGADARGQQIAPGLSQRAKDVIERSVAAAHDDRSTQVGSEHLLLALIEVDGVASALLAAFGATADAARSLIGLQRRGGTLPDRLGRPRDPEQVRVALQRALAALREQADGGQGEISVAEAREAAARADHLARLLADLPAEPITAADLIDRIAADTSPLATSEPTAEPAEPEAQQAGTDRFLKFSERARRVMVFAEAEARRFHHGLIGSEHLLLGLTQENEGVAAKVLANLGIERNKVRAAVEFIIGIGRSDRPSGEIALAPRAKRVIDLAVAEARRLNEGYIGSEHLLLGLIREGEGIGAGVLESLGVTLERARAELARITAQDQASRPDRAPSAAEQPQAGPPRPETAASDPMAELARMQEQMRRMQADMQTPAAAPSATNPALAMMRATVVALDALHAAAVAAEATGEREYAAGARALADRLRDLIDGRPGSPAERSDTAWVALPSEDVGGQITDEAAERIAVARVGAAITSVGPAKQAAITARLYELAGALRYIELRLYTLHDALARGDMHLADERSLVQRRPPPTSVQATRSAIEALEAAIRVALYEGNHDRAKRLGDALVVLRAVLDADPPPGTQTADQPPDDTGVEPSND